MHYFRSSAVQAERRPVHQGSGDAPPTMVSSSTPAPTALRPHHTVRRTPKLGEDPVNRP